MLKVQTNNQHNSNAAGFSLIEVAIGLMIIGILMGSILSVYNLHMIKRQENDTKNHIIVIQNALSKFAIRNGRFPIPADRSIPIGTAGFGKELATPPSTNCAVSMDTACTTPGGLVYIGDVPFATLGIHYKNILDAFGSKMTYAVTASLTNSSTFSDTGGEIQVIAEDGSGIYTTPKAQFFVASHGSDKQGAYSLAGTNIEPCGIASVNGTDTENCDKDDLFRSNYDTNILHADTYNKFVRKWAPGSNNFDDYTGYQNTLATGLWSLSPSGGNLINTNTGLNIIVGVPSFTSGGSCTIDPSSPKDCLIPPLTRIDVRGDVKADKLLTKKICGANTNCTEPSLPIASGNNPTIPIFAGTPNTAGSYNMSTKGYAGGGILCGPNNALRAFYYTSSTGYIDEFCTDSVRVQNYVSFDCPSGEYAIGINSAGIIQCSP